MYLVRLAIAGLASGALAPSISSQTIGSPPPELDAIQWYNSPPLTLEDLKGWTALVEVFRTW